MQNIPHDEVAIINQIACVNRIYTQCIWDFKHFINTSLFIIIIHIWKILIPTLQMRKLRCREGKKSYPKSQRWHLTDWGLELRLSDGRAHRLYVLLAPLRSGALYRGSNLGTSAHQRFLGQQYQVCTRLLGVCKTGLVSRFPLFIIIAPWIDFLSMTGL